MPNAILQTLSTFYTLTANQSTDVTSQPKLSSHWDDRFSCSRDVKYCGRVRHFLGFADDNQVSLYNRHYGALIAVFDSLLETREERKREIFLSLACLARCGRNLLFGL